MVQTSRMVWCLLCVAGFCLGSWGMTSAHAQDRVRDANRFPSYVWPVSRSDVPDYPLNDSFGPRQLASEKYRYDFHRGLDIPVPIGTPLYAVADGTVFRAGEYKQYTDPVVVLRHKFDGQIYHTYYTHLDKATVSEGQVVKQGEQIGLSGASQSGFPHLHIEMRRGSNYAKNALHPLRFLDYPDTCGPSLEIVSADTSSTEQTVVTVSVSMLPEELDLTRVEVGITEASNGTILDTQVYDMEAWNATYSAAQLDDGAFNGVRIEPDRFNRKSGVYKLTLTFTGLQGVASDADVKIIATAIDVRGNATRRSFPSR